MEGTSRRADDADGVDDADDGEHARLILQTASDAFISADEDGTIVDWNRAAERTLGWSRAEAVGRRLVDTVVPPDYHQAHLEGVRRWRETGEGRVLFRTLELPARHRDGHDVPAEVTIWPSRIAGRSRVNAFVRDVSERVRANERLAVLRRVTEAANAAHELEDAIATALEEIASLTGWPVGHAHVRDWRDRRLAPTGWWTASSAEYAAFQRATEHLPFSDGSGLPGRVAASGRPAWIEDLAADPNFPRREAALEAGLSSGFAFPLMSEDRVVGVLEFYCPHVTTPGPDTVALTADVGVQLGRVFERLRWRTELRDAMQASSRALSMVAHEVRTPVFTIEGYADLLVEELSATASPSVLEHLAVIKRQSGRLQRLVSKALLASRLETRAESAQASHVPLAPFVRRVLADLDLGDVELRGDVDVAVAADPDHLEQMLTNYLTNALAYGKRPVWVEVAAQARDLDGRSGAAVLQVCDRGPGVPPAFVPDLFRSFHRGPAGGSGAGLGLSIARELAELNGGEAWYQPLVPTGAAFAVRLPLSPGRP